MTNQQGREAESESRHEEPKPAGLRGRIVSASPPAPVPTRREPVNVPAAEPVEDKSDLRGKNADQSTSDRDVVRATGTMAIATLLSRITGFLRQMLIGATLGAAVGTAFSSANQIPNLVTEIVLGAVLTSLVVPVLVRAEKEDSDRGEVFIRRLFTLAFSLLGVVTLLSVLFAPLLTELMLPEDSKANSIQAISFAYFLLPQIFFYGLFALSQAVLNTKNIFGPGAWAPVINNIISISVLLMYRFLPGSLHPDAPSPVTDPHVILLGLGTTTGVVVQALILLPYLKKAGINMRPMWGLDDRIKQFGSMAVAIIAYVAISQAGYVVTSRVAAHADAGAPLVYQNAWLLLQVPYGIIGVTLLTAIMPRLSRNAADGDVDGVVRDLTLSSKLTFIALIPIVIFMTAFGTPIARALFQYGSYGADSAEQLGLTISFSAFTLIPYALVLLHLRVFYAREEAWTPTFIIAGITFTKVVLTLLAPLVASTPEHVVILLGTANGFGFISGAVIGAFLLKRKLGSLGGKELSRTIVWATVSGVVGVAITMAANWLVGLVLPDPMPSIFYLLRVIVFGILFVVITGLVLSRSGLPEVQNLGRALHRIPGMARFIKVDNSQAIEVEEPELQEIQSVFTQDSFNSSPVPPPMSAGIVRGPRLVPGAPVSDGRFRLLKDHGSVAGARFWQAREQSTGRTVALTFVDTTNQAPFAPANPGQAARRSAAVARNTRKLGELGLTSVAPNIEVLSYRSGCLVVADWVAGTELKMVAASDGLDPHAVAHAMGYMVEDTATAHEAGVLMGLDHRDRIRISTDGVAVLAFPAVLSDAAESTDRESLSSALDMLVESTSPTPKVLRDIAADAELSGEEIAGEVEQAYRELDAAGADDKEDKEEALAAAQGKTLAGIAHRLYDFAPDDPEGDEALPVSQLPDDTPEETPEPTAGFGGRGYSGSGVLLIGVLATIFVVLMAALTTWVMSILGNNTENAPINTEAVKQAEPTLLSGPPLLLDAQSAHTVPANKDAKDLIDGDKSTRWSTEKAETGVVLRLEDPVQLRDVIIDQSGSSQAKVEIYAVESETFDPTNPQLDGLPQLASEPLQGSRTSLDLKEKPEFYDGLLVWISELPKNKKATLADIRVAGVPQ
ncbi:murein biosynthesis integral membrane protein MurJ [Corynebacterium sp. HMSC04H06]|uniref:murein biosynthesis integral membrane protein MurJ n=1 Tax=Corynebacterium sp. HMSC04H06 TaxID=1581050 RepID=UPI0008A51B40|nr:murein biosynthesis integral membrane protein MurJ [Corynebacterium sp. HMSC04H06]OFS23684.1 murein biosynthesis protein MurJ [Corynebacterium sp. HMSC04H06]